MKLLAFRVCEHDSNFSFYDGKSVTYYKSERLFKQKHHAFNNLNVWPEIVKDFFETDPTEIDEIAIVADPWLYNLPWTKATENFFPSKKFTDIEAHCPVQRVNHHYAHALSVYEDFDVHVVIDGYGDKEIAWTIFKDDKIIESGDLTKYGSIGQEMAAAARILSIESKSDLDLAGKLMALQSYGRIDEGYLNLISNDDIYNINKLFNFERWIKYKGDNLIAQHTAINWIRTVHERTGEVLLKLFQKHCNKFDRICFTGGVALNVVWNTKLKKYFPNLFIPPHCADEGLSLGALEFLRRKHKLQKFNLKNFPYIQSDETTAVPSEKIIKDAAELLAAGKTVGWFQGHGEIGPRALGNRSILMDPRLKDGKQKINKIKRRENYRPFGASVMHDKGQEVFQYYIDDPFMTFTSEIDEEKYPAIAHVDKSCRYQSVKDGLFYDLLKKFYEITDCPILLNTSFNMYEQPIAAYDSQALELLSQSELDCLVLGNFIFSR